jgi:predicted RNA-binding Zn ribbon-like protein
MASDTEFSWLGNELCLDFHNTTTWAGGAPAVDRIPDFARLVDWCGEAGILGAASPDPSGGKASGRAAILSQATSLRAVLHAIFSPAASGRAPPARDLAALNEYLALVVMRVDWDAGADPIMASEAAGELPPIFTPIVWSAASLLVSPYRDRIGQCANPKCGWLYVDLSRRGNRRWCDMQTCGNRAKAQRHYARHG